MSDEMLRDLVVRMATDPEFAERIRSDPGGVAAEHGLTVEQVGALAQLGDGGGAGGPSMLDARLSKSSLFFGGGMHADPHAILPTPFHSHGGDATAFACDGAAPAPGHGADLHPAGFSCDGAEPAPVAVGPAHADPHGLLCNGRDPTQMGDGSVHSAAIGDRPSHPWGFDGDGHASQGIAGPDHAGAMPSAAAPISLLTGKVVAPVDSHGAGVGATADTQAAGPGGGPVSHGIVGPDKAHGIVGPDHQLGIVGPDKPQVVGPDHVHGIVGPDLQHGIIGPDKPEVAVPASLDVQAAAPKIDPHALLCDG